MIISAPLGSVELNGLNLDGNANPTDTTPGLSVTAGRRIISNNEIAVNKGDIELTGGNTQATDGVYLGNSGVASSFGAAGSLIALLLWVYYSAQIFFLGAEFTRQYALQFGSLQHEGQNA